jgi:CRP-like cAMP-binding protein
VGVEVRPVARSCCLNKSASRERRSGRSKIDSLTFSLRYRPGDVITQEGDGDLQFFVIAQGFAAASLGTQPLGWLDPGSYFPQVALLDRTAQMAKVTVKAETDMELLAFSVPEFRTVIAIPAVSTKMREFAGQLRQVVEARNDCPELDTTLAQAHTLAPEVAVAF